MKVRPRKRKMRTRRKTKDYSSKTFQTIAFLVVLRESQLRTTVLDRNLWQIPTCDVLRKKVADLPDIGTWRAPQREKPEMHAKNTKEVVQIGAFMT